MRKVSLAVLIVATAAAGIWIARRPAVSKPIDAKVRVDRIAQLPLYFIENRGQLDPRVACYAQGRDNSIYFTQDGITFALTRKPIDRSAAGLTKDSAAVSGRKFSVLSFLPGSAARGVRPRSN